MIASVNLDVSIVNVTNESVAGRRRKGRERKRRERERRRETHMHRRNEGGGAEMMERRKRLRQKGLFIVIGRRWGQHVIVIYYFKE